MLLPFKFITRQVTVHKNLHFFQNMLGLLQWKLQNHVYLPQKLCLICFDKFQWKFITSQFTHKWKKRSLTLSCAFCFEVIKTCWKIKTMLKSSLQLLPGGWWLRKDWRNRDAWTHKNSTSVFLFDIVTICAFETKLAASKMNHKFPSCFGGLKFLLPRERNELWIARLLP